MTVDKPIDDSMTMMSDKRNSGQVFFGSILMMKDIGMSVIK
ncbi:hypothetical protein [Staphylococcus intermedius]